MWNCEAGAMWIVFDIVFLCAVHLFGVYVSACAEFNLSFIFFCSSSAAAAAAAYVFYSILCVNIENEPELKGFLFSANATFVTRTNTQSNTVHGLILGAGKASSQPTSPPHIKLDQIIHTHKHTSK